MNNFDFNEFGESFYEVLALKNEFSFEALESLLKFLPEAGRTKILEQTEADLNFFRKHDKASADYEDWQMLTVRRAMKAVLAHRIFTEVLAVLDSAENNGLFKMEHLATRVQALTGVEIHPQAQLKTTAIDHGTGTVIGATTSTGEETFIYHGVTLGATKVVNNAGQRHPQLGSNNYLGNNSQVLGPSILGNGVSLGAGSKTVNAKLGDGVVLDNGVVVKGVEVPPGVKVFESTDGKYRWAQGIGSPEKWSAFEKIDLTGSKPNVV